MGDIRPQGESSTWENNREEEGFIQKRLDRFFVADGWILQWDTAEVRTILRQPSDHLMLLLDSKPMRKKTRARSIFDSEWTKM